jgi:hypothetical protein
MGLPLHRAFGGKGRALVSSFVDFGLSFIRPDAVWQRSRSLAGASISGVEILRVLRGKTRIVAFPFEGSVCPWLLGGFALLGRKRKEGKKKAWNSMVILRRIANKSIFILGGSLGTGLVRCLVRTVSIIYRLFSHAICSSYVCATDYFPVPE